MKDVIVVEDEPCLAEVIQNILQDAGYQTKYVSSIHAAIELIKKNKPLAVLSDIHFPNECGLKLLKFADKENPEPVPIIYLSGSDCFKREDLVDCGAYDFFTKPFRAHQILSALEQLNSTKASNLLAPST